MFNLFFLSFQKQARNMLVNLHTIANSFFSKCQKSKDFKKQFEAVMGRSLLISLNLSFRSCHCTNAVQAMCHFISRASQVLPQKAHNFAYISKLITEAAQSMCILFSRLPTFKGIKVISVLFLHKNSNFENV